jgi:hypothetical protein
MLNFEFCIDWHSLISYMGHCRSARAVCIRAKFLLTSYRNILPDISSVWHVRKFCAVFLLRNVSGHFAWYSSALHVMTLCVVFFRATCRDILSVIPPHISEYSSWNEYSAQRIYRQFAKTPMIFRVICWHIREHIIRICTCRKWENLRRWRFTSSHRRTEYQHP